MRHNLQTRLLDCETPQRRFKGRTAEQHTLPLHKGFLERRVNLGSSFLRSRELRKLFFFCPLSCLMNCDKGPVPGIKISLTKIPINNMGWGCWGNSRQHLKTRVHCVPSSLQAQQTFVYQTFAHLSLCESSEVQNYSPNILFCL